MKGDNVLLEQFYDIKSTGVDMNDYTRVHASAKNRGLSAIAGLTKREYQALVRRVSQMNLRIPEADYLDDDDRDRPNDSRWGLFR